MSINEYERIQDVLMVLGNTFQVKFVVSLAFKDKQGYRQFFYREYRYASRYKDANELISIKRNIKCYILIEEINNKLNSVMISRADMPLFRNCVTNATRWLQDTSIFGKNKGGNLVVLNDVSTQMNVGGFAALLFEPVICVDYNGNSIQGIRMSISDTKNYVDIEARNFMELYELVRNFDMYTAAVSVLASIPFTEEDREVNRTDFEQSATQSRQEYERKPGYFDKK